MVVQSPRISARLLRVIEHEARRPVPVAEIWRRTGAAADGLGLTRPSYEQVRRLAQAERRRARRPTSSELLVDVAFRARPPDALLRHAAGH